jgi:hypothetical protein
MVIFLWGVLRNQVLFIDFVGSHGIDRDIIDLFIDHQDEPAVGCMTCHYQSAGTAAGRFLEWIAEHAFYNLRCEPAFRDMFHIASGLVIPDDIISWHGGPSGLWLLRRAVAARCTHRVKVL